MSVDFRLMLNPAGFVIHLLMGDRPTDRRLARIQSKDAEGIRHDTVCACENFPNEDSVGDETAQKWIGTKMRKLGHTGAITSEVATGRSAAPTLS